IREGSDKSVLWLIAGGGAAPLVAPPPPTVAPYGASPDRSSPAGLRTPFGGAAGSTAWSPSPAFRHWFHRLVALGQLRLASSLEGISSKARLQARLPILAWTRSMSFSSKHGPIWLIQPLMVSTARRGEPSFSWSSSSFSARLFQALSARDTFRPSLTRVRA